MNMLRHQDTVEKLKCIRVNPILSKSDMNINFSNSKMQNAVAKFEKEAKDKGISIPPILKAIDSESGIPAILNVKKELEEELPPQMWKEELVDKIAEAKKVFASELELPTITEETSVDVKLLQSVVGGCETETQTDETFVEHNFTQTNICPVEESSAQTNISSFAMKDDKTQTHCVEHWNNDAQTIIITQREDCAQTIMALLSDAEAQTMVLNYKDEYVQTHLIEQPLSKRTSLLSVSSESSLEWDPIDGMHAEKQKKVGELKSMFDAGKSVPKEIVVPKKGQKKKLIDSATRDEKSMSPKNESKEENIPS